MSTAGTIPLSLPPNILALFAARPPVPYVESSEKKGPTTLSGMADFVKFFDPPHVVPERQSRFFETRQQRKERRMKERIQKHQDELTELIKLCTLFCFLLSFFKTNHDR